jgi:membrane-associated phospholipid phosphatase
VTRRLPGDAFLFVVGAVLFDASRVLARREGVHETEESVFRAANEAPDSLTVPVRSVMQMGTFITVPVAAAVALLSGRRELAAAIGLGGTAAWVFAKQAKPLGGRARPAMILEDVRTRESIEGDLGWVSGHTAVATTIAATTWVGGPGWLRPFLVAGAATTAYGRMYVGAHLPLDLVGGAGLGLMISAIVRRLLPGATADPTNL